ncbi:RrF2 family transcriptional regulator [Chitinispirillales bacterium ANBcel5]|uniref:RrF2 family transcriptional regulator n=1 Tax=Cellulosispirillum alkaliphilum TaxID=3039283 RepID=UPI002A523676|nr:RrF2 family transcriptional regulator [Chitinispirillales bacterium ANBcel5]
MKLSTRCEYGVRAMVWIAQGYSKGAVRKKDILENDPIPESYLENLLTTLRTCGFLHTKRGVGGGYALTRPPSQITMLQIVEALDGALVPRECVLNHAICDRSESCFLRESWNSMYAAVQKTLGGITLQDLVKKSGAGKQG